MKRNWHHALFAATASGVLALAGFLVWGGLDPVWQPRLASFPPVVGTLLGPFLGLMAILLGVLYNAKITRGRDDRLREQERQAVAAAIHGELIATALGLKFLKQQLAVIAKHAGMENAVVMDDKLAALQTDLWRPNFDTYLAALPRLGLIGPELSAATIYIIETVRITATLFRNRSRLDLVVNPVINLDGIINSIGELAARVADEHGISAFALEDFELFIAERQRAAEANSSPPPHSAPPDA